MRTKTVLCFGDSNTHGYDPRTGGRYDKKDCWVSILQKRLGKRFEIIPEGLNGRTTAYDRPGAPWENGYYYLQPCLVSHAPLDYVVIMLGTNDCIKEMNLTARQVASGMEKIVKTTKEVLLEKQSYYPRIIVVAPPLVGPNFAASPIANQLSEEVVQKTKKLPELYEKIAKKYDCEFLDGSSVLEVSSIDSEHLTLNGHKTLAKLLAKMIKDVKPYKGL